MNNHVHSAPQLERKKEKNREERKKNDTLQNKQQPQQLRKIYFNIWRTTSTA